MRPQQHLSLEKARATFPTDCTCVQPGLLGTANTLSWCLESKGQLGSGLGMVYVALGEHSLLIGSLGFLFCKALVQSLRDENPSSAPYILRLEAGFLIPQVIPYCLSENIKRETATE